MSQNQKQRKPKLISEGYKQLNEQLHDQRPDYGKRSIRWVNQAKKLMHQYGCNSVLDYGCGKATLTGTINGLVNYDPCIEKYSAPPKPCDMVLCTDVLEHIEPECLDNVLSHIRRCANKIVLFSIATRPDASKTLPDGSNPHKIIQSPQWWLKKIEFMFEVEQHKVVHKVSHIEQPPIEIQILCVIK